MLFSTLTMLVQNTLMAEIENQRNFSFFKTKLILICLLSLTSHFDTKLYLQGVPQHFGHLRFCNFSAARTPRVRIWKFSRSPFNFNFKNVFILIPTIKIDQISTLRRKKWKLKTNIFLHKNSSLEYVIKS